MSSLLAFAQIYLPVCLNVHYSFIFSHSMRTPSLAPTKNQRKNYVTMRRADNDILLTSSGGISNGFDMCLDKTFYIKRTWNIL